ncbi:hypothetical protein [Priestia megaterium]|uniref:hypothetical protein n=1 Tax=Priestia megaterium TaxID=1404 RepID=UPI003CC5CDB5
MEFKKLVEHAEANKKEHFKRVIEENKRKIEEKRNKENEICETHNRLRCGECSYVEELKDEIKELKSQLSQLVCVIYEHVNEGTCLMELAEKIDNELTKGGTI